jgi:hypothetical protein
MQKDCLELPLKRNQNYDEFSLNIHHENATTTILPP